MSRTNIKTAGDLRAEMARKNVTKREVSEALGLSYDYVRKILSGRRSAEIRRDQISDYLESKSITKELRGIA